MTRGERIALCVFAFFIGLCLGSFEVHWEKELDRRFLLDCRKQLTAKECEAL